MFDKIAVRLVVVALLGCLAVGVSAAEVDLGAFCACGPKCAHNVAGNVKATNDREIVITGFTYDGQGPGSWFHGQLKGSDKIDITDPTKYVTLPFKDHKVDKCDNLTVGQVYDGKTEIHLTLPQPITDFKTIGILCFKGCHNFGYVVIPEGKTFDKFTPNPAVVACPSPNPKRVPETCQKIKDGDIPSCPPPTADKKDTATQLTFISGWLLIFSLFLSTRMTSTAVQCSGIPGGLGSCM